MKELISKNINNQYKNLSNNYFINGYKIEDNYIILNYNNDKYDKIPYSNETEQSILKHMKKQVINTLSLKDNLLSNINSNVFSIYMNNLFLISSLALTTISKYPIINYSLATLFTALNISNGIELSNNKKDLKEINKYLYFLENKDLINEEILMRFYEFNPTENEIPNILTINDIDSISFEELQETVDNIKLSKR